MKKLLMLGSIGDSLEMIEYAKSIGVYTITTDYWLPEESPAKLASDEFWMISTAEVDLLEQKCREEGITAITEGGSDFNREIMMELTTRLGLPCYISRNSYKYEMDKAEFKRACREVGVLVPQDYYVSPELTQKELEKIDYPVMVKPVDQSGNRGVAYCYSPEDVRKSYAEVRRISDNPNTIIEKMIDGPEYLAYYAIANGEARFLDMAEDSYTVEGKPRNCYVLANTKCDCIAEYLEKMNDRVIAFLKHIDCKEGYAWVQLMKGADGRFYLIEMGYRLSGEFAHSTFPERHGFDPIAWMTNCALGISNDIHAIDRKPPTKQWGLNYMLWTDRSGKVSKVLGLEAIAKYPGMHIMNLALPGKYLAQYSYPIRLGYAYDTPEEVISMIKYVNEHLRLLDENDENMIFYYTDFEYLRKKLS